MAIHIQPLWGIVHGKIEMRHLGGVAVIWVSIQTIAKIIDIPLLLKRTK
jgi:hypothetical protein